MWNKDDLIYVAGFLDGEGCFDSHKNGKIRITCTNTYKPTLDWLTTTFGGNLQKRQIRSTKHRQTYAWQITAKEAASFCKAILPYLKEKSTQANILLDLQTTKRTGGLGRGKKLPLKLVATREKLRAQLTEAKHVQWK